MRRVSRLAPPRPLLLVGIGLLLLTTLPGCRALLGNRYNNFRAYYNTFYNARKAFEQGEEQLERTETQRVDRSRFVSVFTDVPGQARGGAGGSGPFQDAIDKSADLLRERPDSKWVDDALLLIGKARYYQNDQFGAEQKFRETIEVAEQNDQPELADEARFWLGRTLAAAERYDEAAGVFREALAREGLRQRRRAELQLALGELFVQQRRWPEAAEALVAGIPEVRDSDTAARAQFLLGQVLEADGRYEEAAEAYAAVMRHRPVYELGYAALLSEALVLGLDAGQHEEALRRIQRMRRDDKNFQNRAEVELTYARLLAASGDPDAARERFERLLYDEEFRGNTLRSEVYFRYGEFYRDVLGDYTRASVYLDTAATGLREEPGREELVTRAALVGVRREAEVFRTYARIARDLQEADSLLYLGSLSPEDFQAAIEALEIERRRLWEEEQRLLARRRAESQFGDAPVAREFGEGPLTDEGGGRGGSPQGTPGAETGFLNYRDQLSLQDGLIAFQAVWGDRPLAPNWRRSQAIAVSSERGNDGPGTPGSGPTGPIGGPPPLSLADVPRTLDAQVAMRSDRAALRYELGNVLFLSLAQPDSAAFWYQTVMEEDAEEPVALRARYALAEVRRAQGLTDEANALYQRIIEETPDSDLAAQARDRLGLPPLDTDDTPDFEAVAAAAYEDAYARWTAGAYRAAVADFLALAEAYPDTDAAPRALLAAARAFGEWAARDSLDALTGLSLETLPPTLRAELASTAADSLAAPDTTEVIEDLEVPDAEPPSPEGGIEEEAVDESLRALWEEAQGGEVEEDSVVAPEAPVLDTVAADTTVFSEPLVDSLALASPLLTDTLDAEAPPADTTETGIGLVELYELVEDRYPGTRYAERARTLRQAVLVALAPETVEPDPLAEDDDPFGEAALPTERPQSDPDAPADNATLPPDVVAAAPEGTFGLTGETPLDPAIGGYTWRVAALPSDLAAQALLRSFGRREMRAGVYREEGEAGALYVLVLGQFPSVVAAVEAATELPPTGVGRDRRIVELTGRELLDPEALGPEQED